MPSEGPRPTYHAGEQLPIVVAGHPSRAVELEPAVLAGPHAQQARVHLRQRGAQRSVPRAQGSPANDKGSDKSRS